MKGPTKCGDFLAEFGIGPGAQSSGPGGGRLQTCKRIGKVVQRAAEGSDVGRVSEIFYQDGVWRQIFQVPGQVLASSSPTNPPFVCAKDALEGVIGAVHHVDDLAVFIKYNRVAEKPLAVASDMVEDHVRGRFLIELSWSSTSLQFLHESIQLFLDSRAGIDFQFGKEWLSRPRRIYFEAKELA